MYQTYNQFTRSRAQYHIESPLEKITYALAATPQTEVLYYPSRHVSQKITYTSHPRAIDEIIGKSVVSEQCPYTAPARTYSQTPYTQEFRVHSNFHEEYQFTPDPFLKPGHEGRFIGQAQEIQSYIEEAFETMFSQQFPTNIQLSILPKQEFQKLTKKEGVIGLSINRKSQGLLSEVFVLEGSLARVMLTLGHELGHVLTPTLSTAHDEEAKAYAFSFAWMQIIKENNIANLADAFIIENPAINGLHDVACNFVMNIMKKGTIAWHIYQELIQKILVCPRPLNYGGN